ncbi:DUF1822 family protein [Stanieria cyanosphaera]|uniref:DUF1822 family protein n=1 Tax=Stanieria cyanosphaera TaxID=102116 RepID=UPI0002F7BC29|nr:DUF1822 family protein [Stanieria cyanosphaera]
MNDNYFSAVNSREITSQSNYCFASTKEFPLFSIYPFRQLEIAGQIYLLSIIPQNDAWRFQLQNKTASGLIPGGFKLRVLTETGDSFPQNEAVARKAVDRLYVDVHLVTGSALTWEIEPIPEGYQREILIF